MMGVETRRMIRKEIRRLSCSQLGKMERLSRNRQ